MPAELFENVTASSFNTSESRLGELFNMSNSTLAPTTQNTQDALYQEPYSLRIIRLVFQTIMFLGGLLGNFLICLVTSKKRGHTSTGNLLILHLAISDLGILLICFPFMVIRSEVPYSWPFGGFVCKTLYPFSDIFYGVEIGCITAIAFYRYRMLVHCNKAQMTLDKAKKVVFVIWFFAFILIVAPLFFVMTLYETPTRKDCHADWPNPISHQLYSVTSMLVFYVIPLTVILVTYVKIRAELRKSNERHNSYRRANHPGSHRRRRETIARVSQNRRAIQILTPVVLVFTFSMLPFNVFRLLVVFNLLSKGYIRVILFKICSFLLMANSSVNPLIYSVVNSEFRRELYSVLRCSNDAWCSNNSDTFVTINRSSSNSHGHANANGGDLPRLTNENAEEILPLNGRTTPPQHKRFKTMRRILNALLFWQKFSRTPIPASRNSNEEEHEEIELQARPFVIEILVNHETGGF